MSVQPPGLSLSSAPVRQWLAELNLEFTARCGRTGLSGVAHKGPLRVQRPFYPEGKEVCHVYLLHPPGGLVVGDELTVSARLGEHCHSLITTPSAGKLYAVPGGGERQKQLIQIQCAPGSRMEWLPQETLVFDGANGYLNTRFDLAGDAQLFAWDLVCLGRPASNLPFNTGSCLQEIELWRGERRVFLERNHMTAGSPLMSAKWGLQGCHTSGTLLATLSCSQELQDSLSEHLQTMGSAGCWGITQKDDLFIARYLGNSARECRAGFEHIWQVLRPHWCARPAHAPRIWST